MDLDVAILGAGAAGMMAAIALAEDLRQAGVAARLALFEKNVRPGIKVLVCGGGRCNFTNDGSRDFLISQFGRNGRFLTPSFDALDNQRLRDFFADLGVPSHVEHDGKVYPDSNQAKSVVDALVNRIRELHVSVLTGPAGTITRLHHGPDFSISTADGREFRATALILAVGGMSYQRMGTVGDGYRFAAELGHSITTPRPAIVGLLTREDWPAKLSGLAVRDVAITIPGHSRPTRSVGDLLLTHFGLSGPAILNPSEIVAAQLESSAGEGVEIRIDFARHQSQAQLHDLFRDWQQGRGGHSRKQLKTMLSQSAAETIIRSTSPDLTAPAEPELPESRELRLPGRLVEMLCRLEEIEPAAVCASLTSGQMHHLASRLKACPFTITATRGFKEAMVTAGGVKLSQVEPRTMESRLVPRLFITGEVLDLTGPSGGYNLQMAFSTGYLAGRKAAEALMRR